jgi:hypothetical protein
MVSRPLPHGHAAAVHAMARKLGFPALLGPQRDLAYALVISRVIRPASKLSTAGWWDDVTLGPDLGVHQSGPALSGAVDADARIEVIGRLPG